jgi:WD40 repeat protein
VSDDGRLGVIAGGDSVALWDPVSMSMLRTLKHEGVGGACASSDGHRVISSGWDWKVRVWDARGGKQLASWGHARGTVGSIAISADGELALSCGTMDGTVTLRRAGSGKAVETLVAKKDRGYVSSAVFSHDGRTLYLGHRRGAILIFSVTP